MAYTTFHVHIANGFRAQKCMVTFRGSLCFCGRLLTTSDFLEAIDSPILSLNGASNETASELYLDVFEEILFEDEHHVVHNRMFWKTIKSFCTCNMTCAFY